jgi:quinol monooxygenase YgiN
MTRTTIDPEASIVTLINVFTVAPDRQRELVDLLDEATDAVMRHRPGFVSANIHASVDGQRVVNYAQWESEADFRAMLDDPVAQQHMRAAVEIAEAEPRLYTVAATHHV